MKKTIYMIALVCTMMVWQRCATKENTGDSASPTTEEVAAETQKKEAAAARRASLEKARAEKAEQRRLAYLELIRTSPTYTTTSGKLVYYKAEVDPKYKGGEKAMMKYLHDNLNYPQEAQDKEVEGTVFVDFVVDQNGNVTEVIGSDVIGENADILLKEEAVRVVAAMPQWVAGTQRGVTVDTHFSVPITFELAN
jgi:TonB family protein